MRKWLKNIVRTALNGRPRGIVSHADFVGTSPQDWYQAFSGDTRLRTPPRHFGALPIDFETMVEPLPALGVYMLRDGRAISEAGRCFSANGILVRETTWYGAAMDFAKLPASFPSAKRLTGICLSLVSEFAAGNYGHYLLDCLSRLGIATKAGWSIDRINHFYIYEPPSESARKMLNALGIAESKCVWANNVPSIVADTLLVTTFPGTRRNYATVVPATLAEPVSDVPSAGRRIFLPRRGVRSIENTVEIEEISKEMGLEIYDFRAVDDEFSYFREAEMIVGAHGAALTNIAVCHPKTKVLELIPSDHIFPYYYTLAESAGLEYAYICGRSSEMREKGTWGPSPYNFTVDPDEYRSAIKYMINELDNKRLTSGNDTF